MFFLFMIVCNLRYAAVRKMNKVIEIKLGRHAKKKIASNVFLVLLTALVKRIIKSADRKLEYYLQCVR